jgi:hypothetical protein
MSCMANKMRRRGGDGDGDTSVFDRASVRARHEPNVGVEYSCSVRSYSHVRGQRSIVI